MADDEAILSIDDVRAAIGGRSSFAGEFRVDGHPVPVTVELDPGKPRGVIGWLRGHLEMHAADHAGRCNYYHVLGVLAFGDVAVAACVQGQPAEGDRPRLVFVSAGPPRLDVPDSI